MHDELASKSPAYAADHLGSAVAACCAETTHDSHDVRWPSSRAYWSTVVVLSCLATAFAGYRAWVADDAFITFRHVMNVHAGHGPVFNAGERVQGFTHPLWFLLLTAGSYLLDVYAVAVAYGLLLTGATVVMLGWFLREYPGRIVGLLVGFLALLSSRTFVEYQTSGLETSVTALLITVLFGWLLSREMAGRSLPYSGVCGLAGLLILNRPDYVLFCSPIVAGVLWRWWGERNDRAPAVHSKLTAMLWLVPIGLLVVGWYAFATVYYGTPLPNTAYAKTSVPLAVSLGKGYAYAKVYFLDEPLHSAWIIGSLGLTACWAVCRKQTGLRYAVLLILAAAVLTHLAYVTCIGGDFMRGRLYLPVLIGCTVMGAHGIARVRVQGGRSGRWLGSLAIAIVVAVGIRAQVFVVMLTCIRWATGGEPGQMTWIAGTAMLVLIGLVALASVLVWKKRASAGMLSLLLCVPAAVMLIGIPLHYGLTFSGSIAGLALLVAVPLSLLTAEQSKRSLGPLVAGILLLAAVGSLCDFKPRRGQGFTHGIADEWAFWAPEKLQNPFVCPPESAVFYPGLTDACREYARRYGPFTLTLRSIGMFSYRVGPDVRIIDLYGLTDPFVSRCHARPGSRIGHSDFEIPRAYLETRMAFNLLADWPERISRQDPTLIEQARQLPSQAVWDPQFKLRCQRVSEVASGDLWAASRWRDIWWYIHPDRPGQGRAPADWKDFP